MSEMQTRDKDYSFVRYPNALVIVLFVDPIAIPLTVALAKTKISPNQITFISGVFSVFAASLYLSTQPNILRLGALFFYVGFLFDQIDGKLARLKGETSEFGKKFDLYLDSLRKIFAFPSLLYSQFYVIGGVYKLVFGIILVGLHYLFHVIHTILHKRFYEGKYEITRFNKFLVSKNIARPFSRIEELFMVFIIGPLWNFEIIFIISLCLFILIVILPKVKIMIFGGKGWR